MENMFKGHLNNLHSCVGKQNLMVCVCDCGDVCAHFSQLRRILRLRNSLCAPDFSWLNFGAFWLLWHAVILPSPSKFPPTSTQARRGCFCHLTHVLGVRQEWHLRQQRTGFAPGFRQSPKSWTACVWNKSCNSFPSALNHDLINHTSHIPCYLSLSLSVCVCVCVRER